VRYNIDNSRLKKILSPTDFSELSVGGVVYACQLAKDAGAEVIIFNVVLMDETNTVDTQEIERHKKQLGEFITAIKDSTGGDLKISNRVDARQPFEVILDCAEKERADLIVVSSHGRSGLSRMLIGSVTDKLLRSATCPVLVVPAEPKR